LKTSHAIVTVAAAGAQPIKTRAVDQVQVRGDQGYASVMSSIVGDMLPRPMSLLIKHDKAANAIPQSRAEENVRGKVRLVG
jgi:hypothetical protein